MGSGCRPRPAISCACRAASRMATSTNPTSRRARCSGFRRCRNWKPCSTSSITSPTQRRSCASQPITRWIFCRRQPTTNASPKHFPDRRSAPRRAPMPAACNIAHKENHMVSPKQVCVIGAGVSGLAAAKAFAAHGHRVTIIEKSRDLGGVWDPARSYPDVQTQSPKELYRYTDKAMPASYPEWPRGPQVHAYLCDYAQSHGLDRLMRLETSVVAMERRTDGEPGWTLELTAEATSREDFDFVAICTGQFCEPQNLSLPGEGAFTAQGGQILHSSRYNDAALAKGRKVVVLGGSKSATDIAVNAVNSGASEVTIVYREPVWRIPYFIGGLVNFKRILYIRAQEQMFASWGIGPLARLAHAIAKPLVWANWRGLESLLKAQFKLGKCKMVPETRIEDGVNCSVPIATPGFFPMVADGRIKAIRGTFDHYEASTIVMTGGERVSADIAVLAIGYKLGVPFLPEPYRAKLVEPDGQYR